MTAPSSLGTFVKQTQNGGDNYKAQDNVDKLLLVYVREYKEGMTTKHSPAGDGKGVIVDLVELLAPNAQGAYEATGLPYISVLWMGKAVADQLSAYAGSGAPIAIFLKWQTPAGGGNSYIAPEQAEGELHAYAANWFGQYPTFVDDVKRKRAEEAKTAAVAAGLPAGPAAAQPTLGAGLAGPAPVQAAPPAAVAPLVAAPVAAVPAVPAVPQATFQQAGAPAVQQPAVPAAPAPVAVPAAIPAVPAPAATVPAVPQPSVVAGVPAVGAVAIPIPTVPAGPAAIGNDDVDALMAEINNM